MEPALSEEFAKFAHSQMSGPQLPSGEPNLKPTASGEKFDIFKVDYAWIEK
jgi:hypothetical protein